MAGVPPRQIQQLTVLYTVRESPFAREGGGVSHNRTPVSPPVRDGAASCPAYLPAVVSSPRMRGGMPAGMVHGRGVVRPRGSAWRHDFGRVCRASARAEFACPSPARSQAGTSAQRQ